MHNPLMIVLNGTSSSGKGCITEEYRFISENITVCFGMDMIFRSVYAREDVKHDVKRKSNFITYIEDDCICTDIQYSPEMITLFKNIPSIGKQFLNDGFDVILDDVLLDNDQERIQAYYEKLNVEIKRKQCIFVYVECEIEEKKRRERERMDRKIGLVAHQSKHISHTGISYDLVIDTTFCGPRDCAEELANFVNNWRNTYNL